jgi:hypothetical protein
MLGHRSHLRGLPSLVPNSFRLGRWNGEGVITIEIYGIYGICGRSRRGRFGGIFEEDTAVRSKGDDEVVEVVILLNG